MQGKHINKLKAHEGISQTPSATARRSTPDNHTTMLPRIPFLLISFCHAIPHSVRLKEKPTFFNRGANSKAMTPTHARAVESVQLVGNGKETA